MQLKHSAAMTLKIIYKSVVSVQQHSIHSFSLFILVALTTAFNSRLNATTIYIFIFVSVDLDI